MLTRIKEAAVIGFGSQGRAQAIRLRNAGVEVVVGLRTGSRSQMAARRLGFKVSKPREAVAGRRWVAVLVPDRVARQVLDSLGPHLASDCAAVFAAGYPLVFPTVPHVERDLLLVAPHGPGRDLEAGQPMSGFVGVAHDATGRALRRARLYARTVGLKPLFETSPRSEALGDLFGEQTLLCGGLVGLASAVAGVMVRRGIEPAHAWFETVGQLETLARLLAGRGMRGFWDEISDCAAFGSARAAPRLFGPEFARALGEVWKDVESGRFAEEFQKRGRPRRYPREWEVLEQIDRARRGAGGAIRGGRTSGTTRGRVTRSPVARPRTVGRRGTTSRKKKGGRGGHPS